MNEKLANMVREDIAVAKDLSLMSTQSRYEIVCERQYMETREEFIDTLCECNRLKDAIVPLLTECETAGDEYREELEYLQREYELKAYQLDNPEGYVFNPYDTATSIRNELAHILKNGERLHRAILLKELEKAA
jgi:hypothetical protein